MQSESAAGLRRERLAWRLAVLVMEPRGQLAEARHGLDTLRDPCEELEEAIGDPGVGVGHDHLTKAVVIDKHGITRGRDGQRRGGCTQ